MKKHSIVEWVRQAEEKWGSIANTPYNDPLMIKCRAHLATNRRNEEKFENLPWEQIQSELDIGTSKKTVTELYGLKRGDIPRAIKNHIISDNKWKQARSRKANQRRKELLNAEAEKLGL